MEEDEMAAFPPMTEGGAWIEPSPDRPVVYVIHPDHIKRLLMDGGRVVPDPRQQVEESKPVEERKLSRVK